MSTRRYKVLHGFQAPAGQLGLIARGLRNIEIGAANVIVAIIGLATRRAFTPAAHREQ